MSATSGGGQELPTLTFELAQEIGVFDEYEYPIGPSTVRRLRELTNDSSALSDEIVPPGLAAIFGREAYLRGHSMPGGGVLLSQSIRWLAPATVERPLMVQAEVKSASYDGRKRILVFQTTARQNSKPVCEVTITARWPS